MMAIDPGAITLIQTTFLQHIADGFTAVSGYAANLLYIFAVFEVVVFGLLWALQQGITWERLFFKVIKIGLIFFVIQNYAYLLNAVLNSFVQLGGLVANTKHLNQVIFNPAEIWKYGYNVGVQLLQSAVSVNGLGLSLLEIILGFGVILVFGLLGIQIILQLVGFYLIALIALLFLPFGAFNLGAGMFDRAVQTVLKAGVRVMVLIMVIGVAVTVWHSFNLVGDVKIENINQPLGLFFTALLFLYLAVKLPSLVAEVIGEISTRFRDDSGVKTVEVPVSTSHGNTAVNSANAMQAATAIGSTSGLSESGVGASSSGQASQASHITVMPQASSGALSGGVGGAEKRGHGKLSDASTVEKQLSDKALKQVKKTIQKMVSDTIDQ